MTTLGFIGAGRIGGTVARLAAAAGDDVVLSNSRGPQTLAGLIGELGPRARAGTPAEAAQAGDPVVVSIPMKAYLEVPACPLAGKVVVDTNNYYSPRDGQFPELDRGTTTSSELLQEHLPAARVVKCFNNIFFGHLETLARPAGSPERTALPIAGDDPEAKAAVTVFLDRIGYDAVDVGRLAEGRRFQPGTPLYGAIYAGGAADFAARAGVPAGADVIRRALAGEDG
jgi:8-hydroxy-5-deazaflavin:NADPH oxidoreductase